MDYNLSYWKYQKKIGETNFHVENIKNKFNKFVKRSDRVLDFGCGGGFVLNSLDCQEKFGIEINDSAIKQCKKFGIQVEKSLKKFKNNFFDVIISNSALEHVENPFLILKECNRVLKPGGKIIFSLPHEDLSYEFKENDINGHLYTWSPMSAGNLFKNSGFHIETVTTLRLIQPKFASIIFNIFGLSGYFFFGKIYRWIRLLFSRIKTMGVSADIVVSAKKIL